MPDQRLPPSAYHHPDPTTPDKTYGRRAALIDGFELDRAAMRIPKSTFDSTDIAQWLALDVAARAIADAGYARETVPRDRTGVILGNTLTGEHTRASAMRTRWPFVEKTLRTAAAAAAIPPAHSEALARIMEGVYKSAFAPVTEDTLAGGLSNTIAGRICNHFDLHGGGYTVDGACASSLLAVCTAASQLDAGALDLALAGGVDVSLDNFELIGFAKTGALTPDEMRVYDRRGNGFIPGEGCAFVVLKRLAEAVADGDHVYAVIRGWGVSSDGKGGLTAPSRDGQATALRRAYDRAGYGMDALTFIEGHGTGTRVGDKTELEGIAAAMDAGGDGPPRAVGVTSLKSLIGHTKAAAGIGAFIKAVMATNRRVLPPTAGCEQPNPAFDGPARRLFPILRGATLDPASTVRAGVSAMGFGGINTHVTLESGPSPSPRLEPALDERALLASWQDAEVFPLSASSIAALADRLDDCAALAEGASVGELTDLAAHLARELDTGLPMRAAIVADAPEQLAASMRSLAVSLREAPPAEGRVVASGSRDAWAGCRAQRTRIGFLFPGQGSQQLGMGARLVERHPWARALLEDGDRWVRETGGGALAEVMHPPLDRAADAHALETWRRTLAQTDVAQPAICVTSLLLARRLADLGVTPAAVAGHSLGELSAFRAAGAFDDAALLRLATVRGQAMAAAPEHAGAMASLACSRERAEALLVDARGYVVIANINAPEQVAVSGEREAVEDIEQRAAAAGIATRRLPVSNAFHSRLIAGAAGRIASIHPFPDHLRTPAVALFSGMTGDLVAPGTALRDYFAAQAQCQVDFDGLVRRMRDHCDLFLEVGPGRVLSGLATEIVGAAGPLCLPVAGRPDSDRDLLTALAAAFCHGTMVHWSALYERRLVRPFVPSSARMFIDNPCERPLMIPEVAEIATEPELAAGALAAVVGVAPDRLARYLRRRRHFLAALIHADLQDGDLPDAPAERGSSSPVAAATPPMIAPPRAAAPLTTVDLLVEMAVTQTGFPRTQVTAEARLLDDLNLDSIKAGALVAAAAQRLGVAGRMDPLHFANARLGEIAAAFDDLRASDAPGAAASGGAPPAEDATGVGRSWVRNFVVDLVDEPLAAADATDWGSDGGLIVGDSGDSDLVRALQAALAARRVALRFMDFHEAAATAATPSHLIVLLPRRPLDGDDRTRVAAMAARLHASARLAVRTASGARVILVQFGGGSFGRARDGGSEGAPEACSALGFAASLHLERPGLAVRVVDLPAVAPPELVAARVVAEAGTNAAFVAAAYDAAGVRRVGRARVQSLATAPRRALVFSPDEVILVTGGAKGITAECALVLARATGARFALVGTSPEAAAVDSEVARTLERFRAEGLSARYYRCDVAQLDEVEALVGRVRADLGPIAGVIHGAGLNRPRRVEHVSFEDAIAEISPKLLGGFHLSRALDGQPPRLFVGLTSIIGITGMPGNAWYAWANAALDLLLRRFRERHPSTITVAAAYSVWSGVGMGVRLGSLDGLRRLGIDPLAIEEGTRRFVDLVTRDAGEQQVVVTGRLGRLDTWPGAQPPRRGDGRFVQEPVSDTPGVAWAGRTTLSLDRDLYLRDHLYRGSYLFPTVLGLEAMVQAAACLEGGPIEVIRVTDVRLERPIVVAPDMSERIEVYAERMEDASDGTRLIAVGIRAASTGFALDHFAATLVLGVPDAGGLMAVDDGAPLALVPARDLYGPLLFQGPLFQRIRSILSLDGHHVVFRAEARAGALLEQEGFAPGAGGPIAFGDPFFRDALLQSVQLTVPRYSCLPVRIGAIERFGPPTWAVGSARVVRTTLLAREADEFVAEVTACDESGRIVERLTGYRLRILHERPELPTAEELAVPRELDERALRGAVERAFAGGAPDAVAGSAPVLGLAHVPGIHALPREERRALELPLVQRVFQAWRAATSNETDDPRVTWEPSGRPRFAAARDVSLSIAHDDTYCVCAVGGWPQGVDLVPVTLRSDEEWRSLLGHLRDGLRVTIMRRGDLRDRAGSRVWAAAEAALKALGEGVITLSISHAGDEVVLFDACTPEAKCRVATLPVALSRGPDRILALALAPAAIEAHLPGRLDAPAPARGAVLDDGLYGTTVYDEVHGRMEQRRRFVVAFEEANALGGRVSLSRHARWIGRVRELAFAPVASSLMAHLASGRYGLVTNSTQISVVGGATALDVIESRAHLDHVDESSGAFGIEFFRVPSGGSSVPVGMAQQRFTWVRVLDHGVVAAEPMPAELRELFHSLQTQRGAAHGGADDGAGALGPDPASGAKLRNGRMAPRPRGAASLPGGGPQLGPLIADDLAVTRIADTFMTSLEHGNAVGNIYWAHYFTWPAILIDRLVYTIAPDYLRSRGERGALASTAMSVDHTREAMPFDPVHVSLVLRAVFERGASFDVHYFREGRGAERARLAAGRLEVAWLARDGQAAPWPEEILRELIRPSRLESA